MCIQVGDSTLPLLHKSYLNIFFFGVRMLATNVISFTFYRRSLSLTLTLTLTLALALTLTLTPTPSPSPSAAFSCP